MIEIIIMISVMIWFFKEAKINGRNGFLWAFIAAISFYGPVLLFGFWIFPGLIEGKVTAENQSMYSILGVVLNIIIGVSFLLLARFRLNQIGKKRMIKDDKWKEAEEMKLLADFKDPNRAIGRNAYDKNTKYLLGKIANLNVDEKTCSIISNIGKETIKSFQEICIKIH